MSQTQPELSNAITDLFGDSDSDEDDIQVMKSSAPTVTTTTSSTSTSSTSFAATTAGNLKENLYDSDNEDGEDEINRPKKNKLQFLKKSSNAPSKNTPDDDDLFQSDEEDAPPVNQKKRLQKNDSSSSSQAKKKMKTQRKEKNNEKKQKQEESSDEYDSDADVKKTKEDDAFIDRDDDDDDLLQEYDNDNQIFNDERPQFPRGRGGAGGVMPSSDSSSNTPKVEDDPLSQALADMKKKKTKELSETQKGEIAHDLLHKMDKAFHDDRLLYEQQLPAIHKLKLLPHVKKMLLMKQLQMTLLDYDLLSVLKSWIEPIDKTALAGLTIRSGIYELLSLLPCQTEHIRRSGIGKVLVSLLKHKMETAENRQKIRDIIEKWSRPIFGKSLDARALDRRHKERLQTVDETQYIRQQAMKHLSPRVGGGSGGGGGALSREEDLTSLLSSKIETTNDASERVRLPISNGFLFSSPVPNKSSSLSSSSSSANNSGGMKSKKETEKGKRQELTKSLKQLRSDSGKKTFRLVQAAVSGRDKA